MTPRAEELARDWGLRIVEMRETPTSLLAFGTRGSLPIVLKLSRPSGDEWDAGATVQAFGGHGMVRAYEHRRGAVLLERLIPATPLTSLCLAGQDDEATAILADVIRRLVASHIPSQCPTVAHWGRGFAAYLRTGDQQIPRELVERGQSWYDALTRSQQQCRLLHGDLQHYNVLHDAQHGWLAIDPKGVVGEIEYELGASLRNPGKAFTTSRVLERRLGIYGAQLSIAVDRVLAWAYAQAVLSVIWQFEDGLSPTTGNHTLRLAQIIEPMLPPAP